MPPTTNITEDDWRITPENGSSVSVIVIVIAIEKWADSKKVKTRARLVLHQSDHPLFDRAKDGRCRIRDDEETGKS